MLAVYMATDLVCWLRAPILRLGGRGTVVESPLDSSRCSHCSNELNLGKITIS